MKAGCRPVSRREMFNTMNAFTMTPLPTDDDEYEVVGSSPINCIMSCEIAVRSVPVGGLMVGDFRK
jgi:hypothetical protein